jgi:TetR/AcrR family transcriptional regulator, transcriptional repressor for nem operon
MRERGLAGASVDEVMHAAGLTRGGFYSHFGDKIDMLSEGFERAFAESAENLFAKGLPERGEAWREAAARRYLSEGHLDDPGGGCALPSISGEVARSGPELKQSFGAQVERILEGIEARLDGPDARARAIVFLATCVGGLTLARVASDRAVARQILAACRAALRKL